VIVCGVQWRETMDGFGDTTTILELIYSKRDRGERGALPGCKTDAFTPLVYLTSVLLGFPGHTPIVPERSGSDRPKRSSVLMYVSLPCGRHGVSSSDTLVDSVKQTVAAG
jgi:hypothetical protein